MNRRLSRRIITTGITLALLGAGQALADASHLSQEIIQQLPTTGKARDIGRQVPLLVQPNEVPADADLTQATAGCGLFVANGEKGTRGAKFKYEAQAVYITPFGQNVAVRESSGSVKANKQGFVQWDIPLGDVEAWLSGVFSVLFVDIQGSNNKKLDFFSARCRVNFANGCVADDSNACVGDSRFALTLGDGWEVTGSNNLTAIFQMNGTQVEVDVVDACPEGYYVTATRTGGDTAFTLEARDLWTGQRAFLSEPDEAMHLSACY